MYRQDIARLGLFNDLSPAHLDLIASICEPVTLAKDRVIFEQGAAANYLFILQNGQVVIRYKPYDGPSLVVAQIFTGGVFGWSAALRRDIYTSSAIAVVDSQAVRISGESLQSLCVQCPETGKIVLDRLAQVVSERLRSTHTEILGILSQGAENR
ncbi:MAG: cyclic nucleotide-binding domain-containing protein [Anaerolineaceae bacterium]|nr:cyclic nucleotide-binding domain-containing protein [Anaerolineaceae bacterium]